VALILLDRVKVNTTTTGTGTVVLANTAPTGYQTFAVIGNANTTYYTIAGQTSAEWEVGIGTYYLANSSLSRDTILSSSAANAAVTFGVGTKDVFVTYPAERAIYADSSNITTITNFASANVLITGGKVNSAALTGGSINNMTIGATTANTGAFTNITATTINSTSTTLLATSSGNVGVGTIAPLDKLSVSTSTAGGVGGVISIVNGATATVGNEADLGFRNASQFGTTYYSGKIRSVMTNATTFVSDMAFNTYDASGPNGIEAMRLTSSGNLVVDTNVLFVDAGNNRVGIGTATPTSPLTVAGQIELTSGGVKLGNSTIQDSSGNLVFTTGGANTTALTIDTRQNATFAGGIAGSGAAVTFQQSYGGF
jgi:hypothetical protein